MARPGTYTAYDPAPFYFRHRSEAHGYTRLIVWTGSLPQMKGLFYDILKGYPDEVEVLLKVCRGEDREGSIVWKGFYNQVPWAALVSAIRKREAFVFQDGSVQLCLKIPESSEYIALDDHGTLFIYFDPPEVVALVEQHGFQRREERLIEESAHWHVSRQDYRQQRDSFVRELGLAAVED